MDQGIAAIIVGIIGFVGGLVIQRLNTTSQIRHERDLAREARETADKERQQQRLFDALQHFTGGSQHRSVGVAVVAGFWEDFPELRGILASVLTNQAIYLLEASGQITEWHERDNLKRMMDLLLDGKTDPRVRRYYPSLLEVIMSRLSKSEEHKSSVAEYLRQDASARKKNLLRGVDVDEAILKEWKERLQTVAA